jgi:hypothetical protein
MAQRYELKDFTGGLTDYIIDNTPNTFEVFENISILPDRSIETRHGCALLHERDSEGTTGKVTWNGQFHGSTIHFVEGKLYVDGVETDGEGGNPAFYNDSASTVITAASDGDFLVAASSDKVETVRIYENSSNNIVAITNGVPAISSAPSTSSSAGSSVYGYRFYYQYSYSTAAKSYIDIGPFSDVIHTGAADPSSNNITISSISFPSNGSNLNYDLDNFKLLIFRTTDGGGTYYKVGEYDYADSGDFTDDVSDDDLVLNEAISEIESYPAPKARIVGRNQGYFYYGDINDTDGSERPDLVIQAYNGSPGEVNATATVELPDRCTGISNFRGQTIVTTEDESFRLSSFYGFDGSGNVQPITISNEIGCVSPRSMAITNRGLYFASIDGIAYTDGFQAAITTENKLEDYYQNISDSEKARISATYDSKNKVVKFTIEDREILCFYEKFGCFTKWTGDGISATSIHYEDGVLYRGDEYGNIMQHRSSDYDDIIVDLDIASSIWQAAPIIWKWKTVQLDMGFFELNKWATKIAIQGKPDTKNLIQINRYNNGSDTAYPCQVISYLPGFEWGDPTFTWGDPGFVWDKRENLSRHRRFKAGSLRAKEIQLEATNGSKTLMNSTDDTDSYIVIDATAKTATLSDPSSYEFLENLYGATLTLEGDSNTYTILSTTTTTMRISDDDDNLSDGSYEYSITGIPRSERVHLRSVTTYFTPMEINEADNG